MIKSFPPHPNPLPPGERVVHSSPQRSWGVFWHILIKKCIYLIFSKTYTKKFLNLNLNEKMVEGKKY
jgi:hypothetical protein